MPLTSQQKSEIRRHLKYPNVGFSSLSPQGGGGTLGSNMSHLASSSFGLLESKMDSLQPCDEATLAGKAFASILLLGNPPANGNTITLTFSNLVGSSGPLASSPIQKLITCGAGQAGSMASFALHIAVAISQDATLASAGFQASTPIGPSSNVINPAYEIGITNSSPFVVIAAVSGSYGAQVTSNGSSLPEPSVQVGKSGGIPVIKNGFLPLLNFLYGAIGTATTRQGTKQADVFKARQDEVAARKDLYEFYQRELSNFLDVPINPNPRGGRATYGQIVY